jgi:predicted ArsR family transcriptional regulator
VVDVRTTLGLGVGTIKKKLEVLVNLKYLCLMLTEESKRGRPGYLYVIADPQRLQLLLRLKPDVKITTFL